MVLTIDAPHNIVVRKDREVFLRVNRKFGFGIKSKFFKDDTLILETYTFPFLKPFVTIKYQNLPVDIFLSRGFGVFYSLEYEASKLSMRIKLFNKILCFLFKDGQQVGSISTGRDVLGNRFIKFETSIEDEKINLFFLILYITQIKIF